MQKLWSQYIIWTIISQTKFDFPNNYVLVPFILTDNEVIEYALRLIISFIIYFQRRIIKDIKVRYSVKVNLLISYLSYYQIVMSPREKRIEESDKFGSFSLFIKTNERNIFVDMCHQTKPAFVLGSRWNIGLPSSDWFACFETQRSPIFTFLLYFLNLQAFRKM